MFEAQLGRLGWRRVRTGDARMPRGARSPLSLWVTLVRNPMRTLPMQLAILAAAFGVTTVVLFANSIARTAVAPNDFLLDAVVLHPATAVAELHQRPIAPSDLAAASRTLPGVAAAYPMRVASTRSIALDITNWFPIQLVPAEGIPALATAYGVEVQEGRLPQGDLEVAVPRPLARSRALGVGDLLGGPGDFTPIRMRIVGLIGGTRVVAFGVLPAGDPTIAADSALVLPSSRVDHAALETSLAARWHDVAASRPWSPGGGPAEEYGDYRGDLDLMIAFIVGVNTLVLATIGGLLGLIYFRQRRSEFVLLAILGRGRVALLRRVLLESAVVIGAGWCLGVAAAWMFTSLMNDVTLEARGLVMTLADWSQARYAIPLAVATFALSAAVTVAAFVRFDPVAELEERA